MDMAVPLAKIYFIRGLNPDRYALFLCRRIYVVDNSWKFRYKKREPLRLLITDYLRSPPSPCQILVLAAVPGRTSVVFPRPARALGNGYRQ